MQLHCLFEGKMLIVHLNGDFHLGRYIVGYTFGNHVFSDRISDDIPLATNEILKF